MRVLYKNNFLDTFLVNFAHQFSSWAVQVFLLLGVIFVGHDAAIRADSCTSTGACSLFVGALTGLMLYLVVWGVQIPFIALYLYSKRHRSDTAEHLVELHEDALRESTIFNRATISWAGIDKVAKVFSYTVIHITPRLMYIVPARAFASKDEQRKFFELARSRIGQTSGALFPAPGVDS